MQNKSGNQPPTGSQRERYLNECHQLIRKSVQRKFALYLDYLEDKLFQMADKAGNNDEQVRFFETRNLILDSKATCSKHFNQHTEDAYQLFTRHEQTVSADFLHNINGPQGLSLVDEKKLEESLALSSMARKTETRCAEELYALNQRLTAIRGGAKIPPHHSPLEPAVFAEAIMKSLEPLSMDTKSRLIIYKLFDGLFMAWLGKFYHQLNEHLIKRGILANLRYEVKKDQDPDGKKSRKSRQEGDKGQQPAASETSDTARPDAISAPRTPIGRMRQASGDSSRLTPAQAEQQALQFRREQASLQHQQQLTEAIHQFQMARMNQSDTITITAPYSQQELIDTLSTMQLDHVSQIEDNNVPLLIFSDTPAGFQTQFQSQFQNQLRSKVEDEEKQLSRLDADIIEIVGLLFEYMLNDDELPDSAKALLSYLHTPFLKLALLDKEFFEHPQHPARRLLNSLVEAGQRWLEADNQHRNLVFNEMRAVVQRVLHEFDNDVTLFSELALEFSGFLRRHEHRVKITEDRARQAARGEDKLREIRNQVIEELDERTTGRRLPLPIVNLLYEPWANYLSFNLLRFGKGSGEYQAALKVVDEILWYIEPKRSWVGKRASSQMSMPLEELVRAGFETVGYDEQKGEVMIKSLLLCQRLSVEGIKDPEQIGPVYQPEEHHPTVKLNREEQEIVARLISLEFGTWFMFNNRDDKQRRPAKLAWYNAKTLHFMFVNKLGQQIAVKKAEELTKEIIAGDTQVLDYDEGKPFFEKALERILNQLRSDA